MHTICTINNTLYNDPVVVVVGVVVVVVVVVVVGILLQAKPTQKKEKQSFS